ncbi:MAG: prolipoprotein diacylglyceryl transferase [Patescibacteria group bacterium]|nr:prolipoprotein diacylglyceryl transferase [Patescibacteria group bacterium]
MVPVLFSLGPIKLYTFGVFLSLGLLFGAFVLWKIIRLTVYKEEQVFDLVLISSAFGLFFSRVVYVVLNFDRFGFDLLKFILINGYPGLSIYGFLFGFLISAWVLSKMKKIKFLEMVDQLCPPFFLVIFFGKLGAFFSGSEPGTPTNFFIKTRYLGLEGYRHLTAFYEAIFFLGGVFLSYQILQEIRKERFFRGFLFFFSLWFFSLITFLFDPLKQNKLFISKISFNFFLSFGLLLTISMFFFYYFRELIFITIKQYGKKIIEKIYSKTKR